MLDDRGRRDAVMAVVRAHFKPEFLNRLDDVVVFHALSTEELGQIVDIQLGVLGRRLAQRRLSLDVSEAAREWLAMNGFDPVYGARPLRRLVQSAIGDQLAKELLAGEVREGDTVRVDLDPTAEGGTGGLLVGRGLPVATRSTSPVGESPRLEHGPLRRRGTPGRHARACRAHARRAGRRLAAGGRGVARLRRDGSTLRAVGIPSSVWFLVAVVALVSGAALLLADRSRCAGARPGPPPVGLAARLGLRRDRPRPARPVALRHHPPGRPGVARNLVTGSVPTPTARARATSSTTSRPGG